MAKRIAIALLLLPAAEFAVFLLVVWAIGFFPALGLMILTSCAGGLVLLRAGRGRSAQVSGRAGAHADGIVHRNEAAQAAHESGSAILVVAGILLVLPGFITDLVGAGLIARPIRSRLAAAIGRAFGLAPAAREPGAVLDLAPDEWRSVPDRPRPERR